MKQTALLTVTFGLLVLALVGWGQSCANGREAAAVEAERARLATALLEEEAKAQGWDLRYAQDSAGWEARATEQDSALAELLQQNRALGGTVRTYTDVVANLHAALDTEAELRMATDTATGVSVPDSILAEFTDPVFRAWVRCKIIPTACNLQWDMSLKLTLLHNEMPDGRLAVFARSPDPRIALEVPTFYWLPPPAPRVGWHWPTFLKTGPPALLFGMALWEVVR